MCAHRYETAFWSDRKVLHLEFKLADSGMAFAAGDAIGVAARNNHELVNNLIKRLGESPDTVISARAADGSSQVQHGCMCVLSVCAPSDWYVRDKIV